MWFALAILILLLVAAFVQSTYGVFSSLIMVVLTICCAAVAFGTFEWVAATWIAPNWAAGRDYAPAIALAATFGVPLLILRVAADQLIKRSGLLPSFIDKGGAAVCGLVTALVIVGVVATAIQMVPASNGSVFGYTRLPVFPWQATGDDRPDPPAADAKESELWLKPDRFAVGLVSMLSDGAFRDKRRFSEDHPDFIQNVGWLNTGPVGQSRFAPPKSIAVVETAPVNFVYNLTPPPERSSDPPRYDPVQPRPGHVFQMIRVKLKRSAMDLNKSHRFNLRQFRIVGHRPHSDQADQYHAIAIQQEADEIPNRHIRAISRRGGFWPVEDRSVVPRDGNESEVEVVFELPEGFVPAFVEYKRGARATVSFDSQEASSRRRGNTGVATTQPPSAPPTTSLASDPPTPATESPSGRRPGRSRGLAAGASGSRFADQLPMPMKAYRKLKNAEVRRGALVDGHLMGYVDEQAAGQDREVARFRVPSDKRLLQLNASFLKARSGLGRSLSHVLRTIQNYIVEDTNGRRYKVVGKYAVADVDGRRVIEVQYFSNPVGTIGGFGDFDEIDEERHLEDDYEFVLLFLVDPGARIKSFSTGGDATQAEDLTDQNLVAPD